MSWLESMWNSHYVKSSLLGHYVNGLGFQVEGSLFPLLATFVVLFDSINLFQLIIYSTNIVGCL